MNYAKYVIQINMVYLISYRNGRKHICDILTSLEFTLLLRLGAQDGTVLLCAEAGSIVALSIHEL